RQTSRVLRLIDMVATTWLERRRYQVAQVSIYSGSAFRWAEAVCWVLRRVGKPYVLTLHGGNLPRFAVSQPARVRRLLESAAEVTTPSRYLEEQMGPYASHVRTIPNGLDLNRFRFELRTRPRPRLLWLRSFHDVYHPRLAVQAAERLTRHFP